MTPEQVQDSINAAHRALYSVCNFIGKANEKEALAAVALVRLDNLMVAMARFSGAAIAYSYDQENKK